MIVGRGIIPSSYDSRRACGCPSGRCAPGSRGPVDTAVSDAHTAVAEPNTPGR
jgi:hypothetical protein